MKKVFTMILAAVLCMSAASFAETADETTEATAAVAQTETHTVNVGTDGVTMAVPADMTEVTEGIEAGAVSYANDRLTVTAAERAEDVETLAAAIDASEVQSTEARDINGVAYTVVTKNDGRTCVAFTAVANGALEITLTAADGADIAAEEEQILGSVQTGSENA